MDRAGPIARAGTGSKMANMTQKTARNKTPTVAKIDQ
jgi:hypothetical protein